MSAESRRLVLDAWAIMAVIEDEEPAMSQVKALLKQSIQSAQPALLSVINLGEIYYTAGRSYGEDRAREAMQLIRDVTVEILPVDESRVLQAAGYKMRHRISYADSFALASAVSLNATLVTGDPELIALDHLVTVIPLQRQTDKAG